MPLLIYRAIVAFFPFMFRFIISLFPKLKTFLLFLIPYALADIVKLFGVGVVTFTGVKVLIGQLRDFLYSKLNAIAAPMLDVLLLAGLDTIIAMYLATFSIIVTIRFTMGASSKVIWNKPHGTSNVLDA